MLGIIHRVTETDSAEAAAIVRFQRGLDAALQEPVVLAAPGDQVGDGADLEAMLGRKQLQIGQAGHGAVVLHDLADHRCGAAACHGGQVATGFSMACAHQHAAVHRLQREDVAGLDQVGGLGVAVHRHLHGAGTVGRRDAGGHTLGRLDGDGERRAVHRAIARGHGGQLEELAALTAQCQADQAPAEAGHEVDGLGRHVVGGQDEVAFVFAVFFIHQDDDAPGAHLGHDVLDGGDRHGGEGGGHGRAGFRWAARVARTARCPATTRAGRFQRAGSAGLAARCGSALRPESRDFSSLGARPRRITQSSGRRHARPARRPRSSRPAASGTAS